MSLESWIGKGKSYLDAPSEVTKEVHDRITLTNEALSDLTPGLKTIAQVLDFPLPAQSQTTTLFKPSSRFSKSAPNLSLADILKRHDWSIPASSTLEGLDDCIGQAVLDGNTSLELWGVKEDEIYAPLTVVALWKYLSKASSAQLAWKKAHAWSQSATIDDELRDRLTAVFMHAPWHGFIEAVHDSMTVTNSSGFLADGYLTTTHINAMLRRVQRHVSKDVLVGSVNFAGNLSHITSKYPEAAQFEIKKLGM